MITDLHQEAQSIRERYKAFLENNEPLERYPGVTRVLSHTKDMSGLDEWRDRIGHEEADRILLESQEIGEALDSAVMAKVEGRSFTIEGPHSKVVKRLFKQLEPSLNKIVPILVQPKVWSNGLKVMGYVDILCFYEGKLTLLDIKNSRRIKEPDHIYDYWLQTTTYSMCLLDMLGLKVEQLALFIAIRSELVPQILTKPLKPFVKPVLERVNDYYTNHILQ